MSRAENPNDRWRRFGLALTHALGDSKKTQAAVARAIGVSTSTLSAWKTGQGEPERPAVTFALEQELGCKPGTLSAHLGYVPPAATATETTISWEAALINSPEVEDDVCEALLAVFRAMQRRD